MADFSFCFVTPSYFKDFERCELLCKSIQKYSQLDAKHYIIVDKSDLKLFRQLENKSTIILTKEQLLPWWIIKIPLTRKNIWFSAKTLPLRGWVIQQIIKISIANVVLEDILIFVDSDVFFIREFGPEAFVKNNLVRFYKKEKSISKEMTEGHYLWYKTASELLKIPEINFPASDYINQVVTWRRSNVLSLCKTIEDKSEENWVKALCKSWHFSEYVLYGVFIENFLANNSGHYIDFSDISLNYYAEKRLSETELDLMFKRLNENQIAIMISAKSNIPLDMYRKYYN